jgi:hypothetical protein
MGFEQLPIVPITRQMRVQYPFCMTPVSPQSVVASHLVAREMSGQNSSMSGKFHQPTNGTVDTDCRSLQSSSPVHLQATCSI